MNMNRKKALSPVAFILILLFIFFPPLAIVGAIFYAAYKQGKKTAPPEGGQFRTEIENLKRTGRTAKEQFLRRVKEEGAAEQPYKSHPHTPISYSYDSCAREKRLEQLKVLKGAGLLDEMEYQQRRQELLKEM